MRAHEMCRCVDPQVSSHSGAAYCGTCGRSLRAWRGKGGNYVPTTIYNEEFPLKTSDILKDEQLHAGIEVLMVSPMLSRVEVVKRVVDAVFPTREQYAQITCAAEDRVRAAEQQVEEMRALLADAYPHIDRTALHVRARVHAVLGGLLANACPFCASSADVLEVSGGPTLRYFIRCFNLGCAFCGPVRETRAAATEAWNAVRRSA